MLYAVLSALPTPAGQLFIVLLRGPSAQELPDVVPALPWLFLAEGIDNITTTAKLPKGSFALITHTSEQLEAPWWPRAGGLPDGISEAEES